MSIVPFNDRSQSNTLWVVPPAPQAKTRSGTWTPRLSDGTHDYPGTFHGTYTQVGRLVHITAYYEVTGAGSVSGGLKTYLPIQASVDIGAYTDIPIMYSYVNLDHDGSSNPYLHLFARIGAGSLTSVLIRSGAPDASTAFQTVPNTAIDTTHTILYLNGSYPTDDLDF